jgi:hypothetical protein
LIVNGLQGGTGEAEVMTMQITIDIPDEVARPLHDAYERASWDISRGESPDAALAKAQTLLAKIGPDIWHAIHRKLT